MIESAKDMMERAEVIQENLHSYVDNYEEFAYIAIECNLALALLKKEIAATEAEHIRNINAELDENGKKVYSNEASRKAELASRMTDNDYDESMQELQDKLAHAQHKMSIASKCITIDVSFMNCIASYLGRE